ncbi:protein phosphatase 2C family [Kipferlia bialata]|uniref:Protein phosphatase 2C family n=1 Tax=Kipferlia bialata TaxID=797122 RepID=A0A9K3CTJ0_9EUKA|nr:protein phosphatase 2C family [Kipferlia bialata]|eukprot:g3182.t1
MDASVNEFVISAFLVLGSIVIGWYGWCVVAGTLKARTTTRSSSACAIGCLGNCGKRQKMEDSHSIALFSRSSLEAPVLREVSPDGVWRDAHSSHSSCSSDASLLTVCDGHLGKGAACFVAEALPRILAGKLESLTNGYTRAADADPDAVQSLLRDTIVECEAALLRSGELSGTAMCCVYVTHDRVYCGNVGDCRAVLSSVYQVYPIPISRDHKPEGHSERHRIRSGEGAVHPVYVQYSAGMLPLVSIGPPRLWPSGMSLSRAMGDKPAKTGPTSGHAYPTHALDRDPSLSCLPEVSVTPIPHTPSSPVDMPFVVVGCDGIFDVLSNEDAVSVVRSNLVFQLALAAREVVAGHECVNECVDENGDPEGCSDTVHLTDIELDPTQTSRACGLASCRLAGLIVDLALARHSTDNVTAGVVLLSCPGTLSLRTLDRLATKEARHRLRTALKGRPQ